MNRPAAIQNPYVGFFNLKSLYEIIADEKVLNQAFQKVENKIKKNRFRKVYESEVPFLQIQFHRERYLVELCEKLEKKTIRLRPSQLVKLNVDDRIRLICKLELQELILHYAIADQIERAEAGRWSETLFSYQKNKSNVGALRVLSKFLRQYSKRVKDKKKRNLFVLKLDVKNYAEDIVNAPHQTLFTQIVRSLKSVEIEVDQNSYDLLSQCLRPIYRDQKGVEFQYLKGVPVGSPLTPVVCNLYLKELDDLFNEKKDVFYIRYGDDVLIVTESLSELNTCEVMATEIVTKLNLQWNETKIQKFCFNNAGRGESELKGRDQFKYLGYSVHFSGNIGLSPAKLKKLVAEVRFRLKNLALSLDHLDEESRLKELIGFYNRKVQIGSNFSFCHVAELLGIADTRRQLRQFDHQIRITIVTLACKTNSLGCLRRYSMADLIHKFKLKSLEQIRNRGEKEYVITR